MKRAKSVLSNDSGFTLAEVLVAVFITAMVVLPMLSSFLMGRVSTEMAKHRTQAMNLIRGRLEYLNSKGYYYVNQLPGDDYYQEVDLDENEDGHAFPCWITTNVSDMDGDDLLEVEVFVFWQERRVGKDGWAWESVMTLFAPTRVFE